MGALIEIGLEEQSNLIVQRIVGAMTEEDYDRLAELTEACVKRMPAGTPVRILTDATRMQPPALRVRRKARLGWGRTRRK
jgi:hypothetical protein